MPFRIPRRFSPIVAIIPARGGSKRIRRKALAPIRSGVFLLSRTLEQAVQLKRRGVIHEVVVSTEDRGIRSKVAQGIGGADVHLINRPKRLATDRASSMDVIRQAIKALHDEGVHPKTVVLLQVTSPLRRGKDVEDCLKRFSKGDVDSVVSVAGTHPPPEWMFRRNGSLLGKPVVRKSVGRRPSVALNGAVYVSSARHLARHRFTQGRCAFVEMPWGLSLDIDQPADLALAQAIEADSGLRRRLEGSPR